MPVPLRGEAAVVPEASRAQNLARSRKRGSQGSKQRFASTAGDPAKP